MPPHLERINIGWSMGIKQVTLLRTRSLLQEGIHRYRYTRSLQQQLQQDNQDHIPFTRLELISIPSTQPELERTRDKAIHWREA